MKYICTANHSEGEKEEIFVFPKSIDHDCMAEALEGVRNQTHGNWERELRIPVSAGFVRPNGDCYGQSETLGLEARQQDSLLLHDQRIA